MSQLELCHLSYFCLPTAGHVGCSQVFALISKMIHSFTSIGWAKVTSNLQRQKFEKNQENGNGLEKHVRLEPAKKKPSMEKMLPEFTM